VRRPGPTPAMEVARKLAKHRCMSNGLTTVKDVFEELWALSKRERLAE